MICEYCNMYTPHTLNRVRGLLPEIKKKFMLENVDHVCKQCLTKFKTAEQWHVKSQIVYSAQYKMIPKKSYSVAH